MIERWPKSLPPQLANRTKNKLLVVLHGVFRRAQSIWGLPTNPVAGIEKHPQSLSGDIEVFSPEAVSSRRVSGDADDVVTMVSARARR
jgi:hypothetical protein